MPTCSLAGGTLQEVVGLAFVVEQTLFVILRPATSSVTSIQILKAQTVKALQNVELSRLKITSKLQETVLLEDEFLYGLQSIVKEITSTVHNALIPKEGVFTLFFLTLDHFYWEIQNNRVNPVERNRKRS